MTKAALKQQTIVRDDAIVHVRAPTEDKQTVCVILCVTISWSATETILTYSAKRWPSCSSCVDVAVCLIKRGFVVDG